MPMKPQPQALSLVKYRRNAGQIHGQVLEGCPVLLVSHYKSPVAYLIAWWQLGIILDTCFDPSIYPETFPSSNIFNRLGYIRRLLERYEVVPVYRNKLDRRFAFVSPKLVAQVNPTLQRPLPLPPAMAVTLSELYASPAEALRMARGGTVVQIRDRGWAAGYLVALSRLDWKAWHSLEPVTATVLSKKAGYLIDRLQQTQADIQLITVSRRPALGLMTVPKYLELCQWLQATIRRHPQGDQVSRC